MYQLFDFNLLLQGDDVQWGKVHRFVSKIVWRMASRQNAEWREDAVQGAVTKIFRGLPGLRERDAVVSFIRRITTNHVIDLLQQRDPLRDSVPITGPDDGQESSLDEILPGTEDVFAIVAASEDWNKLKDIVASLSPDDQVVFELTVRFLSTDPELPNTDRIAQKLGITQPAYFKRWSRCRKAIIQHPHGMELLKQYGKQKKAKKKKTVARIA